MRTSSLQLQSSWRSIPGELFLPAAGVGNVYAELVEDPPDDGVSQFIEICRSRIERGRIRPKTPLQLTYNSAVPKASWPC